MSDFTTGEGQPFDFRLYLGMLLFRWQIIAVCFLYSLLTAVVYLQITPKKYVCQMNIRSDVNPQIMTGPTMSWVGAAYNQRLLNENAYVKQAVDKLMPIWGERFPSREAMDVPLRVQVRSIATLNVSIRTENPQYGLALLNEVANLHRAQWEKSRAGSAKGSVGALQNELTKVEAQIRDAEEQVFEYERLHDLAREGLKAEIENTQISDIIGAQNDIKSAMWMMEVEFPALKNENIGVIDIVNSYAIDRFGRLRFEPRNTALPELKPVQGAAPDDPATTSVDEEIPEGMTPAERATSLQKVRFELLRLMLLDDELAKDLKPEHPRRQSVKMGIKELESRMKLAAELELWNMRDRYRALKFKLSAYQSAEYRWQAVNYQNEKKQAELNRLKSRLEAYKERYQLLATRLQNIEVSEEMGADYIQISGFSASSRPVWPDPIKILLLALGIGVGVGLGLAFLALVLDNRIQTIRDVEHGLGLPFLGGVPFWVHSGLEKAIRPIVTEEHSIGAVEAYRALRTSVISAMEKAGEKILMVTSADSREGKTLTSLNMAIMMAQLGKRVLLVDMDLRRGRLHRSLGVDKEPGVAEVLLGEASMRSVVSPTRIENLFLAPPGSSVDNAPELMQSVGLAAMFADVQDEFDYIVLDTSPVLRVTDTVILSSQGVGVVLYVARVNHTPKPLIRYSLDILKDARLIGMVLNSIEMHKISSLYYAYQYPNYAYYSNAYTYGYSYAYYGDHAVLADKKFKRHKGEVAIGRQTLWSKFKHTFFPMD